MKCPNCNEVLLMTVRNNVEIDYCPKCRGIWLDRGELDKLLEQNNKRDSFEDNELRGNDYRPNDNYRQHDQRDGYKYHKKKKSFLDDLFDF